MDSAILPLKNGKTEEVTYYNVHDFPYHTLKCSHTVKRQYAKVRYLSDFATFDIESSSVIKKDAKGDNISTLAFMYHWQITIFGITCTGRTWEEFLVFIQNIYTQLQLSDSRTLVIYVHNLGYEFQFAHQFFASKYECTSIFAPQSRKPLKVAYTGLELRCSWKLTNMSLDAFTANEIGCPYTKMVGSLDYRVLRTPYTHMTREEIAYCVADTVSLYSAVKAKMEHDKDNLATIPLTSTGYVRRDCQRACRNYKDYRDKYFKATRVTPKVYELLKEGARGGDTHANRYLSNMILEDIDSYDFQSDYPAQMMCKKYPMSRFQYYGEIHSEDDLEKVLDLYACLFRVTLMGNVKCKPETIMPYIPESKCTRLPNKAVLDNGRVLEAEYLSITVTDIDWRIIRDTYDFDSFVVTDMHIADYGELPPPLKSVVMEYFTAKCELKIAVKNFPKGTSERDNAQYLYDKSKNKLNGIFGMCYTDPVRDEQFFDPTTATWTSTTPNIEESLEKYYSKRSSFLCYAWGVWTTAGARYDLYRMVNAFGDGTIYCDTDSCKGINCHTDAMDSFYEELKQRAIDNKAYVTVDDKVFYLGIPEKENETPIPRFKTMGAKKYCYEDEDGLHLTISGVNKKEGAKELERIENFTEGFTFVKAGGLTMYYGYSPIQKITVNEETFTSASYIASEESTYTLGLGKDYTELLNLLKYS